MAVKHHHQISRSRYWLLVLIKEITINVDDPTPFYLNFLSNYLFIVWLCHRQEYGAAILKGSWMIENNYLSVQKWVPNFMADDALINTHERGLNVQPTELEKPCGWMILPQWGCTTSL